ncbi:hypothetical protein QNI19_34850 [Cytophagaceae bacterium DM2B3-1]|uniref:TerB family tellurite resistance protein n=1 Tax=Xanthocytophaga flava TaxID=3048013 RepID=A0AAE3QRA7_9BACT|nr:hypothetical protein [Xanthocytophaga flavus]MDJ1470935.1 hypothetical protein [Xanthocytophaga flavus]MDJ1484032.1 hypothetical protein [Xanthocytophaga flavus]MDJ1498174.1 hypothetical protein [Xanthocytophaga flavus]
MATKQTWKTFYQRLAYLYYAIAKADEKIVPEEIARVREIVRKEWVSLETTEDEFGSDAAFQIEIAFDWLVEQKPSAEKALEKFEHFVEEHPDFLTRKLKQRILDTSTSIADSFHGTNKLEERLLERLGTALGK